MTAKPAATSPHASLVAARVEGLGLVGAELGQGDDVRLVADVAGNEHPRGVLVLRLDDGPADVLAVLAAPVEAVEQRLAECQDAVERLNAVRQRPGLQPG